MLTPCQEFLSAPLSSAFLAHFTLRSFISGSKNEHWKSQTYILLPTSVPMEEECSFPNTFFLAKNFRLIWLTYHGLCAHFLIEIVHSDTEWSNESILLGSPFKPRPFKPHALCGGVCKLKQGFCGQGCLITKISTSPLYHIWLPSKRLHLHTFQHFLLYTHWSYVT